MREERPHRPYRVVVSGLAHFCRKLPGLLQSEDWDIRHHTRRDPVGLAVFANDLRRCDLVYKWSGQIVMGKFVWAARCLRKKHFVMLWAGSDVLWAKRHFAEGKMHPWIAGKTHWAVSPWVAEEVRSLGIPCEHVQASFVPVAARAAPLPAKFSVLAYIPNVKHASFYGWDQIIEVARALPQIEFTIVGLKQGETLKAPPNVKIKGWVSDLAPLFEQTTVLYRPVQHDGLSFMVLEALAQGRHVLYSCPFSACARVTDAATARRELERLFKLHQARTLNLNEAGIEVTARDFNPETVRRELLRRWEEIILSRSQAPNDRIRRYDAGEPSREHPL